MFNQLIAQNAIVIPFIAEIQLNDRLQMQVTATLEQKNPKSRFIFNTEGPIHFFPINIPIQILITKSRLSLYS